MPTPRYRTYRDFLALHFQGRVQKLPVHGGFSCPHRNAQKGLHGCTYCNGRSFVPPYCSPDLSITEQLERGKQFFQRKFSGGRYLAYFQAETNTHASVEHLKACYHEALSVADIAGLVVATRPDCLPLPVLQLLEDLGKHTFIMVELGIESTDNTLLSTLNRGHDFGAVVRATKELAARGLHVGGHLIVGLPGQTLPHIANDARRLSALPLDALKLHQLQILQGAAMAQTYLEQPQAFFQLFQSAEAYADVVMYFLQRLRPDIALERFTSQAPSRQLIAPRWNLKADAFERLLAARMEAHQAWQGQLFFP